MAKVMLKSLKFIRILNGRLTLSSVKHIHGQPLMRSYTNTGQRKAYATAAYKLVPSEDTGVKTSETKSTTIIKDLDSLDAALSKIDSLIRRNGRTQMKHIHKILSAITSKEITTSSHGLYLIRSCKYCYDEPPSKRIELVNQIWNRYQELGIEFDVRHYNAMLDVHVANGLDFNPPEILSSMEDLNIEPNRATYLLIMKKYCQDGNISGASEILEYMKEKEMSADEKVFNYLIEGHIKNNDITGAKEMVEVMRSSNLQPTADTHTVLACGYAAIGDRNEMMAHLKECGEVYTVKNYLKVIDVLASSGNHQYIDDVLSLIQHKEKYQPEFINSSVELIHKNFIDVAYKLATASYSPEYNEGLNIFIKQLMKVGKTPSEVVQFCERISNEGFSRNILVIATRVSAEYGQFEYIVPLFKKMEQLGFYIKCNNFWTLFNSVKEGKYPEGPWIILKKMCELGVPCDFTTYTEVVFPMLGVPQPNDVICEAKRCGQAMETAADALFIYYCRLGEINHADHLTQIFPVKVSNKLAVRDFVNLYENMSAKDVPTYLKLLKFVLMNSNNFVDNSDAQGILLAELVIRKPRLLENVLFKYEDLKLSEHTLNVCEEEVSVRNPSKQAFVRKLRIVSAEREIIFKDEDISVEDEKKYLNHLQVQNISCRPFLTKRVQYHIKMKNISRVLELLSLFDELKLDYSPLMLSNVLGMWCAAGDIERAKEALEKLTTNFPDFKLDIGKSLDYVTLLIRYEKFDESYEALKNFLAGPYVYNQRDNVIRSVRRFSVTLSDTKNVEYIKKMQSILLPLSEDLGYKAPFLDPVINLHLMRNDLTSAFEEFRSTVLTYRVPACLNHLYKRCINSGENNILQKVIDLTTSCTSKSYALLELAVALIETYNIQKATKVIESLGKEADPTVLEDICSKLCRQNKISEMEQLISITKSLSHVNRERLYCHAFKSCANRNDFQRALELFDKLKEEVIEPDSRTVKVLIDLLKKNNQPLPLSLISKSQPEVSPLAVEATKTFIEHLEAGNVEEALKELNGLKKGYVRTLSLEILTDLIDLCLQKNCAHDLSPITYAMSYIIDNARDVLKPILEKYSEEGDIEKFAAISTFMPDFSLINSGFNTYFCKAFISAGKYETLLSQLEQRIDKKNKLFCALAFEELLKFPELEDRIFNLAVKYMDSNYNLPIAVVWAHYFSKENYEKADEIHKNFSVNFDRVDNIVVKSIKQNENVDLAKKYVNFIKLTNVRLRMKEKAYGTALDLFVLKEMFDEAVALVVEAERQNLQLHKYYLSTLVTLKNILEKENKPVPFSMPLDMSSGSSSGSD